MTPSPFVFGRPPRPSTLRALGLGFTFGVSLPAEEACRVAEGKLEAWERRYGEAIERLHAHGPSDGVNVDPIEELAREAYHAGLRYWASAVFGAPGTVRGTEDLRAWCCLQVRALRALRDCLPPVFVFFERATPPPDDCELLVRCSPLFNSVSGNGDRGFGGWPDVPIMVLSIDQNEDDYYLEADHSSDCGQPLPRRPAKEELGRLLDRAYAYLDQLAPAPGTAPPARPQGDVNTDRCEDLLSAVIAWCFRQEGATPATAQPDSTVARPDGPSPPGTFWLRGKPYEGLTRDQMKILEILWQDRQDDRRWAMEIRCLSKALDIGTRNKVTALRSAVKRLSRKLERLQFPGELGQSQGYIVLTLNS